MPLDHGRRLYQHHRVEDLRPNPVKPNPEKSVRGEEPNPTWALSPQDTHLMSQRDELEFQGGAATKPEAEYGNDGGKNRDHACDGRAVAQKSPAFLGPSEFEQAQDFIESHAEHKLSKTIVAEGLHGPRPRG